MTRALQIIPIPAFVDNYIWLLHQGEKAIVVDPGDAVPVIETLNRLNLTLVAILITHHHSDHVDGVTDLLKHTPDCIVYAPKHGHYHFPHLGVEDKIAVQISLQSLDKTIHLSFNVLEVPGHTLDHIAYVLHTDESLWLFCGDTLFGAGCGRLFEGSPEQMLDSLVKLSTLPTSTKVFCTHEYTLKNIQFALTLDPQNQALITRKLETEHLRSNQKPSLPSTIGLELATNPFLRCQSEAIKKTLISQNATKLEVFTQIRKLRNDY